VSRSLFSLMQSLQGLNKYFSERSFTVGECLSGAGGEGGGESDLTATVFSQIRGGANRMQFSQHLRTKSEKPAGLWRYRGVLMNFCASLQYKYGAGARLRRKGDVKGVGIWGSLLYSVVSERNGEGE